VILLLIHYVKKKLTDHNMIKLIKLLVDIDY